MRNFSVLASILALASFCAAPVHSGVLEASKHGAAVGFSQSPLALPELGNFTVSPPDLKTAAPAQKAGAHMRLTVEQIFDDEYEARQLPGVDLRIRRRSDFPGQLARYEATGELFGTRLNFGSPLVIANDVFGSRHTVTIRGAGMDLRLERMVGWGQMEVESTLNAGVTAEAVAVMHGLVSFLPELGLASSQGAGSTASKTGRASYRFRQGSRDYFYIDGAGMDLEVHVRDIGFEDKEYDITGSAFGKRLGFGDLVVRTDKSFLGPRGYRARGLGVDLVVEHDTFGGRRRVEVRGSAGDSPEVTAFLLAFSRYIFSR